MLVMDNPLSTAVSHSRTPLTEAVGADMAHTALASVVGHLNKPQLPNPPTTAAHAHAPVLPAQHAAACGTADTLLVLARGRVQAGTTG